MNSQFPSRCLICYKSNTGIVGDDLVSNILSRQLNAIFVLRNVLELPSEVLVTCLQHFGGDYSPDMWIWTCSSCSRLINEASKIHEQIVKAMVKLGNVKKRIIEVVKDSAKPEGGRRTKRKPAKMSMAEAFTNESRSFVFKRTYEIKECDPFKEGDLKARQLAGESNKRGKNNIDGVKDGIDENGAGPEVELVKKPEISLAMEMDEKQASDQTATRLTGRKYVCVDCGLELGGKWKLNRHTVRVHITGALAPQRTNGICGKCGWRKLNSHKNEWIKQNKFQDTFSKCQLLPQKFKQKEIVKGDEKRRGNLHTGPAQLFSCNICKKGFAMNWMLRRHEKTCASTRDQHKCDVCRIVFGNRGNFIVHVRSHGVGKDKRA